ncbi:hypothetical protein LINPERHAP2_LOCUS36955, partial [Linum perenne]
QRQLVHYHQPTSPDLREFTKNNGKSESSKSKQVAAGRIRIFHSLILIFFRNGGEKYGESWRDHQRRQRRNRSPSRLGESRVHLPHLPQHPSPLRFPPPIRGYYQIQIGVPEREA